MNNARCLLLCSGLVWCAPNFAEHLQLEEMAVTAEADTSAGLSLYEQHRAGSRLGLTVMEIPASVAVITGKDIAEKGDFSGLSALTRAAGFAANASPGNGGSATSVRGFAGHSSVVSTYDGKRLYVGSGTVSFPADTWTMARIEVLRGPGSVINGVGAIGATVNYVPKKPSFEKTPNELDIGAGSFGLRRFALGLGDAVSDKLAYRIDAVDHRSDGYVDRADEHRQALAVGVLFQQTAQLSWQLAVDIADTDASPYWGTPLVDGRVHPSTRRNNYNVRDAVVSYQDLWPRLSATWQISEAAVLRSELYYMRADRHWRNVESYAYNSASGDVDRSFYLEILHDQEQLGYRADVTLAQPLLGRDNRFNIGLEVNDIDFSHRNNSPYQGSSSVDLEQPAPGRWRDGVQSATSDDFSSDTQQVALFLDDHLQITPQWSAVLGLRYDRLEIEGNDVARSNGQSASRSTSSPSGGSWRIGAVYQPSEETSVYAQYSRALDPIGSVLTSVNDDVALAKGEQVELGVKQQYWQGRLQTRLAVYDIVKRDLLSADPGGVQRQIGEQSSRGIEWEVYTQVSESVSLDFNLALARARYEEFVKGSDDLSGNTPRNVAEKTANLWLRWQWHPHWQLGAGLRYVGERYANDSNTSVLPSYRVYDAALHWQVSDALQISLRGKNLSDTRDYVLAPYGDQWILADGRAADLSLNYRF
ncbi:TonB-dependent receptor [Spongiibacter marinus]|uniref:TonB-dependent receptor n=1 Tax=Spongiibacter marinus TaxID=354246 RepID=UPI003566DB8A